MSPSTSTAVMVALLGATNHPVAQPMSHSLALFILIGYPAAFLIAGIIIWYTGRDV